MTSFKKGFTAVEVLIVAAIVALLTIALASFLIAYNQSFGLIGATVDSSYSAGRVITETSNAIREATQVVSSQSIGGVTYASASTTLVLELNSIDSSGQIVPGMKDYVVFYIDGSNIYKKIEANAASSRHSRTVILSDSATLLSIIYDNATMSLVRKVEVRVGTRKDIKDTPIEGYFRQQTYLRNK